jgi:hypothetical protein
VHLGRWFNANTVPNDVIAVSASGAIPYFAERPAIDMLGLNDAHIARNGQVDHSQGPAHKKYDAVYVLDRAPQFIVLNLIEEHGQALRQGEAGLVSNEALLREPRFQANYTRVVIPGLARHDVVFVRNDRLGSMTGAVLPINSPITSFD